MATQASGRENPTFLIYHTLRSVNSREDSEAGRRRYCGAAPAN